VIRGGLLAAAMMLAASSQSAVAQHPAREPATRRVRITPPWRLSVGADNDAFNFWRGITDRPDKEYTNGDHVTVEFSAAPWWGRQFAKRRAPCTGEESSTTRCLTTSLSIGQDMYTPKPSREPRETADWRDDRPYAAWLYAGGEARIVAERSLRTVSLQLGVTGPPAFGEFAQKTAHKLTGVYSRDPVGWDTQIAFEPGVVLSAQQSARFAGRTASGNAVIDLTPQVGASLGNVLTEAQAGFQLRTGIHLSNQWWTSEWTTRSPFELYVLGAARGEAVAHNITLDGNTFGAERWVDRNPWIAEYAVGIGGRFHGLVAEWRAITRSREYRTGPQSHAYSTLFARYEVPARVGR
jgi:hypothetical protein